MNRSTPFKTLLIVATTSLCALGAVHQSANAQDRGYMRADGKQIVDSNGNNFITRSIGTGNWWIQEGYMMQSSGEFTTHTRYRNNLASYIGNHRTDEFYTKWLDNHFTKQDLDSMKAWGFNALRPALHYKWFTLPIEEEPIEGENTWFEEGFERLDTLVEWCAQNEMYIFLDMHGCPGGQGKDANISDYNSKMSSLWQSEENKEKLIALWVKIAQRYATNPWIGGYDFINEPNWPELALEDGRDLRDIFERLISAVREVDPNHMFIIEGNYWGNDYRGMMPPWGDDNICYSFHKYWNYNTQEAIQFMLDIRDEYNVPLWLGESGENSNVWFADAIALVESNNIGWSWWPVKKSKVNNVLRVVTPESYKNLMSYWESGTPEMSSEEVYQAVMDYADAHLTDNCIVQRDVIDAMIRQPHTTATLPYVERSEKDLIYATDYDLGRLGYAYYDTNTANYHVSRGGERDSWNEGLHYRNDGVDIDLCEVGNGYCVNRIKDNEWLQYTLNVTKGGNYSVTILYSSEYSGNNRPSELHLENGGKQVGPKITLPPTNDKDSWEEITISGVNLKKGENKIRTIFTVGDCRISTIKFKKE